MPFFNRGRIKLNKTFFNSFGSGGGPIPPLPPIRPNSYLKYSFNQRDLTAAITDRVSNSDILTTTIGTDVNAQQSSDNSIITFSPLEQAFDVGVGALIEPAGVNLLPASLLDWAGTGGNIFGLAQFTNDSGLGEVEFLTQNAGDRDYLQDNFLSSVGDNVFSLLVEAVGLIALRPVDCFVILGVDLGLQEYKINGNTVNKFTSYQFSENDILEIFFNTATSQSLTARFGLGTIDSNTVIGSTIKLTQPQVEEGTQRSSLIQPNGAPAQRDASSPVVTGTAIPDSRVSVFTEFIANADNPSTNPVNIAELQFTNDNIVIGYTYDEVLPLFLANSFFVTNPTGDFVIEYTPDQVIQKGDHIKIDLYINDVSVALAYENKTNGEKGILQNSSVFLDLGVGDIIKLGETDALSANYMTMIDFEVTAYTAPPLPDFADNGDFAQNGDFDNG